MDTVTVLRAGSVETCTVDFKYFFNGITYYFICFVKLQIITHPATYVCIHRPTTHHHPFSVRLH